jgi:hypothetical protein
MCELVPEPVVQGGSGPEEGTMGTWKTCTTIDGEPETVLGVLTDPDACRRWSPVRFDIDGDGNGRLQTGTRARVAGRIAGRDVGFDVRILHADERRLALRASGPIDIEAQYDARPVADRTRLCAQVSVRSRGGLTGRLLSGATDALLAAGALEMALARIASEAEPGRSAIAA